MNYADMSDLQVNVAVASRLGVNAKVEDSLLFTSKIHAGDNVISVTTVTDYCNNPSDMWPLIVDNKMDICHIDYNWIWKAFAINDGEMVFYEDTNPLRAAAIVFLMLNED